MAFPSQSMATSLFRLVRPNTSESSFSILHSHSQSKLGSFPYRICPGPDHHLPPSLSDLQHKPPWTCSLITALTFYRSHCFPPSVMQICFFFLHGDLRDAFKRKSEYVIFLHKFLWCLSISLREKIEAFTLAYPLLHFTALISYHSLPIHSTPAIPVNSSQPCIYSNNVLYDL